MQDAGYCHVPFDFRVHVDASAKRVPLHNRFLQPMHTRRMNSSRMMAQVKVYSSDFGVFAIQNVFQARLSDRQFGMYLPI